VTDVKAKGWLAAVSPEIAEVADFEKGWMRRDPQHAINVHAFT